MGSEISSPEISKLGVAMTMTSQSTALLAEASRFAQRLGATLTLIHTGTSETESQAFLHDAASRLAIHHEKHIVWNQTEPAPALARAAEKAEIEMLVVSAFEGPAVERRRFLGEVPRHLAELAYCSLLFIAHPRIGAYDFRRIVVVTDFSDCSRTTCEHALWLAQKDSAESLHIISIHTPFMQARADMGAVGVTPARTRAEEERLMRDFLASLPEIEVPVDWRIVEATTGFAACDFVDSMDADLLVLPGHNRASGRMPPMADWALQVVPCSLWIVHGDAAWSMSSNENMSR
jgi:nucleotide-binding universal stress UspA family protein